MGKTAEYSTVSACGSSNYMGIIRMELENVEMFTGYRIEAGISLGEGWAEGKENVNSGAETTSRDAGAIGNVRNRVQNRIARAETTPNRWKRGNASDMG